MTPPLEKPRRPSPPLEDDEEFYAAGKPVEPPAVPDLVEKYTRAAEQKRVSTAEEPPPPPRWPLLSGILTFPFYPSSLAAWMGISIGLMVTGWFFMVWFGPGLILGMWSARLFGLPTCVAGALTFGYAASCCLITIEETSNGWNAFEVSPGMEWKEWIWNLAHFIVLGLQSAMVGLVVQQICLLMKFSNSWLPMVAGAYAVFPLVLLGALAAEGAWFPLAIGTILRSLVPLWWAWGLFYLEISAMAVGWTLLIKTGLVRAPWIVPLYAAPLLAAAILIYARLTGRLAAYIAEETKKLSSEGDDDEEP